MIMKIKKKAIYPAAFACITLPLLSGCFGYGGYSRYRNQVPKTTAARESLEEFDVSILARNDGSFGYKGLEWGSTPEQVEAFFGVSLGETVAFADGGGYADVNYSIKLGNSISVGMMPSFNPEGLGALTFYFEEVYTAEELDKLYENITDICSTVFGEPDDVVQEERDVSNVHFVTETIYWYHQVDEDQMTSLQVSKTDVGKGTNAVVLGINSFDPALLETGSSGEEGETEDIMETEAARALENAAAGKEEAAAEQTAAEETKEAPADKKDGEGPEEEPKESAGDEI